MALVPPPHRTQFIHLFLFNLVILSVGSYIVCILILLFSLLSFSSSLLSYLETRFPKENQVPSGILSFHRPSLSKVAVMSIFFYCRPDYVAKLPGPMSLSQCQTYVEKTQKHRKAISPELSFENVVQNKALPVSHSPG